VIRIARRGLNPDIGGRTTRGSSRHLCLVRPVLLTLTLALALPGVLPAGAGAAARAARVSAATPTALLTEINRVRAAHGLVPVEPCTGLTRAAAAHSHDMVARGYFLHESGPLGAPFDARIERFWAPARRTRIGEVLSWGTGSFALAPSVVQRWLASPPHRALLLSPAFDRIGIGVAHGRFLGLSGAAVWTADLAR
jgi:uncharacterized protein YkwD